MVWAWILAGAAVALAAGVTLFSSRVRAAVGQVLANLTIRQARRLVVFVVGGTVLLAGLAMLALPGPGIVTVIAGLGLLATEFLWARRLLRRVRETTGQVYDSFTGASATADPTPSSCEDPPPESPPIDAVNKQDD